jgi:hypothetical protein
VKFLFLKIAKFKSQMPSNKKNPWYSFTTVTGSEMPAPPGKSENVSNLNEILSVLIFVKERKEMSTQDEENLVMGKFDF